MKIKKKYFVPVFLLILMVVVAWRIISAGSASDVRRQTAPAVTVERARRETIVATLHFTGDVLPIQQAGIYSKVGGTIERVFADMGEPVRKGDLLALIDTTELAQQSRQTAATYQKERLNYERTRELAARNLIATQELDNAEAAMKVAKANYEAAQTRLSYAGIAAPFGGFVTKRFLDPGAVVTPNNVTLFTLMDLDAMKVIISVLEKDIPLVTIGKKATIAVDAFPGVDFTGKIRRFSEAVDLSTRTMAVEIDIPNADHRLKPGMYADVLLVVDEHDNALTVPSQSILSDGKGSFVFTVDGETARRRDIRAGGEQNGRTEILSGLDARELVVTAGQQFAKDGGQVIVQK